MRALIRRPLLHFLVLGGVLFAGSRSLAPPHTDVGTVAPVVVDGARVESLRRDWLRDSGRAPTAAELDASIRHWVDEELLVNEALRLGLPERDPVVRERLLRNMRFLYPRRRASDEALLVEAAALDMARNDPVARRRLVQGMARRLVPAVALDEPALAAYLQRHAARYERPERVDLRQVFLRDDGTHDDPRAILERQRTALAADAGAEPAAGDPFLLGERLQAWSPAQLTQRFGDAFTAAVMEAGAGVWVGPLRSPYGWHLVRVESRSDGGLPPADAVRPRLIQAWIEERRREQLGIALRELRRRYAVEVADATRGGAA